MATDQKTVIIIAGPTAVGKTAVAIEVAKRFHTEIISADSRQCYKELKIGVARPTEEELSEVTHHFIASHSIDQKITAADFENYSLQKASEIFTTNKVVVMVGGTGLYIKAFCEGLDEIPAVPDHIRVDIMRGYEQFGIGWLQNEVQIQDPRFFSIGEIQNPHRLMRALEISRATGKSILDFRKGKKATRDFRIIKVALQLPKEELHEKINRRVDQMMECGLFQEVNALIPYQHFSALQTVGYKELFDYFNGKTSLLQAIELIKKNSRQYAKRQMTWFRKDQGYTWLKAEEVEAFLNKQQPT